MGADGALLELSTLYTQIYFFGTPFIAVTNYAAAIFNAKGDTKTPLYVLSLSGILNVLLNVFFVMVCGLSVEGVAIATATANAVSTSVLLWLLSKDDGPCRFSFKKCRIDKESLMGIIKEGLPAGINGALFSVSNMIITSSILTVNNLMTPVGSAYEPIVKGNGAAANIGGFVYTAVNSVYQAAITFTSQNVGAKKYKRVWRVLVSTVSFAMIVGAVCSSIAIIFRDPLLSLYGIVDGAEGTLEHLAYNAAMSRMTFVIATYFIIAWQEAGCGVVRGLGKSMLSMIISLIGACGLRVAWIGLVFPLSQTLETIYISYPISWAITGIAQIACGVICINLLIKRQAREDARNRLQEVN
jgi:Na+-driven multidrug efflux pump